MSSIDKLQTIPEHFSPCSSGYVYTRETSSPNNPKDDEYNAINNEIPLQSTCSDDNKIKQQNNMPVKTSALKENNTYIQQNELLKQRIE